MKEIVWIIMPAYNEEAAIAYVIDEWLPELRKIVGKNQFVFCAINDGSQDKTSDILQTKANQYKEIKIINKQNSGHGQTCILGYREALNNGAEWIFQMDSDGQCNPRFFKSLWNERKNHKVIYGYRIKREDGVSRFLISKIVALVTFITTGIFVRDANVPYRLMHATTLNNFIDHVPSDFKLANILISVIQENLYGIKWIDIIFRARYGGSPSVKVNSFMREGLLLYKQMKATHIIINTLELSHKR